jgi:tetratricopeptide (TPR) repeat protein
MALRIISGIWIVLCWAMAVCAWASTPAGTLYPGPPDPSLETRTAARTDDGKTDAMDEKFRKVFEQGYARFSRGHYQQAGEILFRFLSERTPDDEDYEWAEFFFGISLYKLGYSHAAVDTLTNLVTRKPNPQIVGYVLELLEQITRSQPFDREMLIHRALCDQSYNFVEGTVSDFIHYYQGEYDWEHGLFSWGDEHFAKIEPDTYYYYKYLFTRALRNIYADEVDEAVGILKKIISKLPNGDPLKDDARKTLARLYYEKGKFAEADFLYQQIEMNIVEQSQNLLERAWAHYRLGNPERAMGLLYSFQAPSYAHSFTPEFYILKSFIFKNVCHYKSAMQVLKQFKSRYGGALDNIYHRQPLQDNTAMMLVILNKTKVKRQWRFLNLLESEQQLVAANPDQRLKTYLDELYDLKRKEAEHHFKLLVTDEYEKMANAMLQFEEEAHLMEYEIGIDMYQRVHDYHYDEDRPEQEEDVRDQDGRAVYAFQGEFWNDELDDYEVVLPNKCQNAEEWDIFFK